jgi:hypothetical protein
MNSAHLGWFGYVLIGFLMLRVIRAWIEDWEVVSARREAKMQDDRLRAEEEARSGRANVRFDQEGVLATARGWDMLRRGHDPL